MSDDTTNSADTGTDETTAAGGTGTDDTATDTVTLTRAELQALERDRDEARRAAATAAQRQRAREREAAKTAGNFEELYNDANGRVEKVTGLVRTHTISNAVKDAAERLGFRTPSLAARLIDTADITVEVDPDADTLPELDAGSSTLIERRLQAILEREPGLLRDGPGRMLAGAGQNGGTSGTGGNAAMNSIIRRAAGRA